MIRMLSTNSLQFVKEGLILAQWFCSLEILETAIEYVLLVYIKDTKMLWFKEHSVQFSSVPQSCPTLCDPMNPCPSPTPGVHSDSYPSSQ